MGRDTQNVSYGGVNFPPLPTTAPPPYVPAATPTYVPPSRQANQTPPYVPPTPPTPTYTPRVYLPLPAVAPPPVPTGLPDFRGEYGGVVANPGYYGSQPPPVASAGPSWQEEAFYTPPAPPSFPAGASVGQTALAVANMFKTGLDSIKRATGAQTNAELLRRYGPDLPALAAEQLGEWAGNQVAKLPESVKGFGAEALRLASVPFEKVSEPIIAASWGQLPDEYFKLQEQQRAVEAQAATARRAGDWQRHAALTAEAADINRQRQALNAQLMPARRTMSSAENIQQATDIIKAAYGPQQQALVERYRQTAPPAYQLLWGALLDPLNVADLTVGAISDATRTARAAARLAPTTATVAEVAADMSRAGARGNNFIGRLSPFRLTNQSLATGLVNQASDMVPRLVEGGGVDLLGAFIRNPNDAAVVAATGGISASKPAKQTAALLQRALGPEPTAALQKIVIAAQKDDIATVADLARTYEEAARSFFPVGDPSLPARIKGNINNWLSVTFMGYNPGYAFRNAANNLVTAVADGVSPFQSTDSIRQLWLRWGQPPVAVKQGIGSAGDVWKSRETATEWVKALGEPLRIRDTFKGLTAKSPTLQLGQNFERLASERIMAHHVNKFWGQVWPKTVRSWRDDLIKAGLDYQQAEYYSRRMAGAMNPAELRAVMGPPSPRPPAAGAAGAAAVPPGAAPTMGPTAPAAGADLARTVPPDVLDALQATNDPGLVNAVQDAITAADNPAQAAAAVDVVQQIAEQAVDAERAIGEITAAATSAPITDRTAARDFFLRLRTIEQDFITEHRQRTQQVWQQARGMRRDQADMLWEQYWQTTKQQLDRFYTSLNDAEETVGQQMGMTAQAITRAQDYRRFTVAHKDAYIKKLRETWGKSRAAAPEARDVIWDEFYKWSDQHYALKATRDIAWTEQRITDVEEALWNLGQKGAPNVPPAGPEPAPPAPARLPYEAPAVTWEGTPPVRRDLPPPAEPSAPVAPTGPTPPPIPPTAPAIGPSKQAILDAARYADIPTATGQGYAFDKAVLNFARKYVDPQLASLDDLTPEQGQQLLDALTARPTRKAEEATARAAARATPPDVRAPYETPGVVGDYDLASLPPSAFEDYPGFEQWAAWGLPYQPPAVQWEGAPPVRRDFAPPQVVPPAAAGAAKEPWQMTRAEFMAQPHNPRDARFIGDQFHHDFVRESLQKGKPVPANVLADYPDLAPQAASVAPPEISPQVRAAPAVTPPELPAPRAEPPAPIVVVQPGDVPSVAPIKPAAVMQYGEKGARPWNVLEEDYIRGKAAGYRKSLERSITVAQEDLAKLGPKSQKRIQLEANIKWWQQELDASATEPTARTVQRFREEYIETVKKAISKGEQVPDSIIAQRPEFRVAQDARRRYEKGRHTSFANRSAAVNDTMLQERGYKVKRQDGKPIPQAQIDEIDAGVSEIETLFGPMSELFRGTDLTIAHTNGKHPFLSDAGGMYHVRDRTISTGVAGLGIVDNKLASKKFPALGHEWAHWLDHESGAALNLEVRARQGEKSLRTTALSEARGYGTSDVISRAKFKISNEREIKTLLHPRSADQLTDAQKATSEFVKVALGNYWREPREIWARLVEQYMAKKLGKAGTSVEAFDFYTATPGYWKAADFAELEADIAQEIQRRLDLLRTKYELRADLPAISWNEYGSKWVVSAPTGGVKEFQTYDLALRYAKDNPLPQSAALDVADEVPPAERSAGPVALGKETTAYGINDPNQVYNFRYKVVSLDDLIPSHTDSLQPNPAFPPELQPRLRDRVGSQAQIDQIARTLNPEALIDDVRALDRGPMIVGPDNVVESGNGRTLALRKARVENGQRWKAYQERLLKDLSTYELNPVEVTQIKDPVLVRERVGTVDRAAFAAEANQAAILAMSPYEQALQDAKRVRDDLLAGLRVGDDQTVEQALRSPTNSNLVKAFMETVPANERAALMDQYGNLNATGLQRIKAALFAKTYPGAAGQRLTQAFFESLDPGIKNIEAGMFGSLPKMGRAESLIRGGARAAELALADDLAAAVDMYARLKQQGLRISDYLAQGAMFEAELTPFQTELLGHLNEINRSPKKVRELLNAYADAVEAAPPPAQISMFEDVAGPTKEGIYEQIRQAQAATIADAGPLFTEPGPAPTRPAFGSRGTQLAGSPGSLGIVAPGTQQAQAALDRIASIFDDLRRHLTAGSQPVAPLTPAQAQALRTFIEQQAIPAMVRDKTLVGNLATTMRNFALGDYSHKRNIHEWLSYIMPWSYWYTFTYWNWAQRLAQHPSMLANYARYRSALHNANQEYYRQITGDPQAEMPEYWDRQIRLDVGGVELWLDLEKTLMPLQALTSDFKARARGAAPGGEFLEALSNYGPALWPPLIWAYAAWLKQNGLREAAAEWVGYLTPMDRPIKGLTALAREYIPGADKLIPAGGWAPTQLLGPLSNVQGGDIWERRRIGYYLWQLQQAGKITPEEFQEAAYRQSGPAWEQAQQAEAVQRAPGNLAGYLLGQGFKPRTDADIQIDRMWKEWGDVWDKRDTLTPDQWRAEMQAFEARYPWAETVRMSRQYEQEDRLGDYAGLVLDRLGIGRERRANLAASGLTDDLLTKFYDGKYSTDLMTPQEKLIFQGAIEQLGGTLPVKPPAELTAQQQASAWHQRIAEQAVNILNARGGTTYTVDQLREIEAGYYAEGLDQQAYLEQHPELKAYWDAKRQATTTYGGIGLLPKLPSILHEAGVGPGQGRLPSAPAVLPAQLRASEDEYYTSAEQLAARAKYGDDILDLQGLYLGLNDAQRRAWRTANPAAYARLKAYWNDENPSTSSGRSSGYSGRSYSSYRRSYTPRTYYRRSYSSYGGSGGGALPGATPVATDTLGPSGMIGFDASTLQDFEPLYATVRAIDPAFDQLVQLLFGGNIVDLMRRWYAMTPEERAAWQQTHGAEYTRLVRFYTWLTQQRDAGTTGRGTPFARQLGSLPYERPGAPLMPPPVPPTGSRAPVLPPVM